MIKFTVETEVVVDTLHVKKVFSAILAWQQLILDNLRIDYIFFCGIHTLILFL